MTQILKLSCASFSYVNISYVLAVARELGETYVWKYTVNKNDILFKIFDIKLTFESIMPRAHTIFCKKLSLFLSFMKASLFLIIISLNFCHLILTFICETFENINSFIQKWSSTSTDTTVCVTSLCTTRSKSKQSRS